MVKTLRFVRYTFHCLFASYGAIAVSYVATTCVLGLLSKSPSNADSYVLGPYFSVSAFSGFLLGYVFGGGLPGWSRRLIWLPIFCLLIVELSATLKYGYSSTFSPRQELFNKFLGRNCGTTECLAQALVSAPLVSALTYSLGAELRARIRPPDLSAKTVH